MNIRLFIFVRFLFVTILAIPSLCFSAPEKVYKSHGYSPFEGIKLKYPADFTHFEYTNPDAPKGGTLRIGARGTFDSLNTFILKGTPASYVQVLTTASLLTQHSHDERHAHYCYIAESIEWPEGRDWVIFNIRKNASFHDGSPLTAEDVIFSFHAIKEKGLPHWRSYYKNVINVEALSPHRVKFVFKEGENLEMPAIVGQMPIVSKAYYSNVPFDKTTLTPAIGCGPYKVKSVEAGKRVIYERVKNWWGENVPVRKGQYNFDTIEVEYYRDSTVAFEAFKAGEYDYHFDSSAKNWYTGYDFPAVKEGKVIKREIDHEAPTSLGGFFFNTRKEMFKDRRVREAIGLAFDFEWANENLFYNSYNRLKSIFTNTGFSADELPTPQEQKVLEKYRGKIPDEVFTQLYTPPKTNGSGRNRENLKKATLLLKQAGYHVKDNRMVHTQTGRPLEFELITNSPLFLRVTQNFVENLKRIGVKMNVRLLDSAQFELRSENFQYDMIVIFLNTVLNPGNEQRSFWGSVAADTSGSSNYAGVKDPIVDELITKIVSSKNYNELLLYSHALDRIILWGHYVVPLWTPGKYRLAYWNKLSHPKIAPRYSGVGLLTWWYDEKKAKAFGLD